MVQIVDDDYVLVSWRDADGLASHDDAPAPPLLQPISEIVDGLTEQFWPVNKRIHDHPELKFREHIAHDALTEYMRSRPGWSVTPSAYGMETAWVAYYDTGRPGPVVSFNVEMGETHHIDCLHRNLPALTRSALARCSSWDRPCLRPQPHCYSFGPRGGCCFRIDEAEPDSYRESGRFWDTGGRRSVFYLRSWQRFLIDDSRWRGQNQSLGGRGLF
jgi:hypothetical protein